jgi:hypothetical protein
MPRLFLAVSAFLVLWSTSPYGDLRIVTDPDGAEVWQGVLLLGVTSKNGLKLTGLEPGPLALVIRKEGFAPVEKTVTVETGDETPTLVLKLSRSPDAEVKPSPAPEASPSPVPPTKGGRSHKGRWLGLGGAAVAGGAVAVLASKTDPLEVDDDHDGLSEKQGDCNDADPQINPSGAFSVAVTPDLTGAVNCNTPTATITVRATNLGCDAVTMNDIAWRSAHVTGDCFGANFNVPITLTVTSVPSGSRDLIVATRFLGRTAGCCSGTGGYCGSRDDICGWQETYVVSTSKGQFTHNNSYTITFPAGFSCRECATTSGQAVDQSIPGCRPERK